MICKLSTNFSPVWCILATGSDVWPILLLCSYCGVNFICYGGFVLAAEQMNLKRAEVHVFDPF